MSQTPQPGTVGWMDLTVEDAARVRQFYEAAAGWTAQEHPMGGYSDFVMMTPGGAPAGGICHARGANAALPPVWLIYIVVENLDQRVARCVELGGTVLDGPRAAGSGRFCVLRDPAGAPFALFENAA
jgi:predicted enzyme related to lactoylglutathione lyase